MRLQHISLGLAMAWMALIFYLSSQSSLPTPELFPQQDKVIHAVFYGILAILLLGGFRPGVTGYTKTHRLLAVLAASLYGISDELHQSFVPDRDADMLDWLADTTGAVVAVWLLASLVRKVLLARHYAVTGRTEHL